MEIPSDYLVYVVKSLFLSGFSWLIVCLIMTRPDRAIRWTTSIKLKQALFMSVGFLILPAIVYRLDFLWYFLPLTVGLFFWAFPGAWAIKTVWYSVPENRRHYLTRPRP